MTHTSDIIKFFETHTPLDLACSWDNVGLLVGRRDRPVSSLLTCLTVTEETVAEAVAQGTDMIVTHHPLPFNPQKRITTETRDGRLLLALIENKIAVFSPHTAYDSSLAGINQQLGKRLGLADLKPLACEDGIEIGRYGLLDPPLTLPAFVKLVPTVQAVGAKLRKVAVACGAASRYYKDAKSLGCDGFVTGEASFHTCIDAKSIGISLVIPGHYSTEHFAVETLATELSRAFPKLSVGPSVAETNPVKIF
jgi:dinuclear metal center YbgI/SA1388 family protein